MSFFGDLLSVGTDIFFPELSLAESALDVGLNALDIGGDIAGITTAVDTGINLEGADLSGLDITPTTAQAADAAQAVSNAVSTQGLSVLSGLSDAASNIASRVLNAIVPSAEASLPGVAMSAIGATSLIGSATSILGGTLNMAKAAIGGVRGMVTNAAGRILGVILPNGAKVTPQAAAALAKRIGIDAAAGGLGIGAVELAQLLLQDAKRKSAGSRRRRGISYRDIRIVNRTMRKFRTMQHHLHCAAPVRRAPARRGSNVSNITAVRA